MWNKYGRVRPGRKLLISFLLAAGSHAGRPGVRLLEQDRALARQKQAELLDHAADNGARALEQELALAARRLAGPAWLPAEVPPGSVYVVLGADRVLATPSGRLPYFPTGLTLREPPAGQFLMLEGRNSAYKIQRRRSKWQSS